MWNWIILRIKRWVQPELDRALALVRAMRLQLEAAKAENTRLTNRNEQLNKRVNDLESDVRDLQRDLAREREITSTQSEVLARMEQEQKRMSGALSKAEAMIDSLKDRIVKLEAERGRWADFGSNTGNN